MRDNREMPSKVMASHLHIIDHTHLDSFRTAPVFLGGRPTQPLEIRVR